MGSSVKKAGIRFWVLTGDKTETAVEVARSCGLFTDGMTIVFVKGVTSQENVLEMIREASVQLANARTTGIESGIVIDGAAVTLIWSSLEAQRSFYEIALQASACVCCRLSPRDKRRLVDLVRAQNPSTIAMAVGDGANDVSMILGAQVGIGIRGKEGNQAVQACDIAISQFRFIVPLLFCHGRRAYRRIALFLCWYVYKHLALIMGDLIWAAQSGFTGDRAYPELLSSGYTVALTSLSVMCTVAFDQDVPDELANAHPELYLQGPRRELFNGRVFTAWMLYGVWHGTVSWLAPNLLLGGNDPERRSFWVASCIGFTLIVVIVNLRLLLVTLTRFNLPTIFAFATVVLAYLLMLICFGHSPLSAMQPELDGVPVDLVTDGTAIAILCLTPLVALLPDLLSDAFGPAEMSRVMCLT